MAIWISHLDQINDSTDDQSTGHQPPTGPTAETIIRPATPTSNEARFVSKDTCHSKESSKATPGPATLPHSCVHRQLDVHNTILRPWMSWNGVFLLVQKFHTLVQSSSGLESSHGRRAWSYEHHRLVDYDFAPKVCQCHFHHHGFPRLPQLQGTWPSPLRYHSSGLFGRAQLRPDMPALPYRQPKRRAEDGVATTTKANGSGGS